MAHHLLGLEVEIAFRGAEVDAVVAHVVVVGTGQHGDFGAGLGQFEAEIAADGAGADDENFHCGFSK